MISMKNPSKRLVNIVDDLYSCLALFLGMYKASYLGLGASSSDHEASTIFLCLHDAMYLQTTHLVFAWMTDFSAISYYMFHILIGVLSWFHALEVLCFRYGFLIQSFCWWAATCGAPFSK